MKSVRTLLGKYVSRQACELSLHTTARGVREDKKVNCGRSWRLFGTLYCSVSWINVPLCVACSKNDCLANVMKCTSLGVYSECAYYVLCERVLPEGVRTSTTHPPSGTVYVECSAESVSAFIATNLYFQFQIPWSQVCLAKAVTVHIHVCTPPVSLECAATFSAIHTHTHTHCS